MLSIPRRLAFEVVIECWRALPAEACGILAGPQGTDLVTTHIPMHNAIPPPDDAHRYQFSPAEQMQVWQRLEAASLRVVVIYHSHPSGSPEASAVDLKNHSANSPYWLIVGLGDVMVPEFRAYTYADGVSTPCRVAMEGR